MKAIKPLPLAASIVLSTLAFFCQPVSAQTDAPPVMSTPPVTLDEKEAMYNASVEDRTLKIMQALAMTDSAQSNRVHDIIIAHYHALRARDEAIEDELGDTPRGSAEWQSQRMAMFSIMSQPLHDKFVAALAKDLTPAQLEIVKDKMTYGKVEFTYNAYCEILPGLTEADKAKVMELLKQAREVAMDGGSSADKAAIFQEYKNQINSYLAAQGFDVAKATQEWNDRHKLADKKTGEADSNSAPPAK